MKKLDSCGSHQHPDTLEAEAGETASGSKDAVSRCTDSVPVIPALGELDTQAYIGNFQASPGFKTRQFFLP